MRHFYRYGSQIQSRVSQINENIRIMYSIIATIHMMDPTRGGHLANHIVSLIQVLLEESRNDSSPAYPDPGLARQRPNMKEIPRGISIEIRPFNMDLVTPDFLP